MNRSIDDIKISDFGNFCRKITNDFLGSVDDEEEYEIELVIKQELLKVFNVVSEISDFIRRSVNRVISYLKRVCQKFAKKLSDCVLLRRGSLNLKMKGWLIRIFFPEFQEIFLINEIKTSQKYEELPSEMSDLNIDLYSKYLKPTILVVGPTGSGKSTICRYVFGTRSVIKADIIGATEDYATYETDRWNIIDSVGLNEMIKGRVPHVESIKMLIKKIKENLSINLCLIVVPNGRISDEIDRTFKLFKLLLPPNLPKMLVLTKVTGKHLTNQYDAHLKSMDFVVNQVVSINIPDYLGDDPDGSIDAQYYIDVLMTKVICVLKIQKSRMWNNIEEFTNKLCALISFFRNLYPEVNEQTVWDAALDEIGFNLRDKQSVVKELTQAYMDGEMDAMINKVRSLTKAKELIEIHKRYVKWMIDARNSDPRMDFLNSLQS